MTKLTDLVKGDPKEMLCRLARPFFESGHTEVICTSCCKRVFVGVEVPASCRVCGNKPENVRFRSLEEIDPDKVPTNTIP